MNKFLLQWSVIFIAGYFGFYIGVHGGITLQGSLFLGIFLGTILGLILNPVPGQQVVFLSVMLLSLLGVFPLDKTLSGYADSTVWLVLSACLFSRGIIKTGLGKRVSLHFIKVLGNSPLGLGYALSLSDLFLGSMIPSNGARNAGVIFPIAKEICETYESKPGESAHRLGSFLFPLLYQMDVLVCSLFITGQASNVLIAKFAKESAGVDIDYLGWLVAVSVPGLVSFIGIPYLLYYFNPPSIRSLPEAPEAARKELEKIGSMHFGEKLMVSVFALVVGLWITHSIHHISYTTVAMLGVCCLLFTGILKWEDITSEKGVWDIFIWFGGLIMLASGLQTFGITQHLASRVAGVLSGYLWPMALAIALLVYFYSHYLFASVTAHVMAMFVPFLAVVLSGGAPPFLAALLFAVLSNLSACLTHYGTTPGAVYFGAGYVSQKSWWKIGFWLSLFHLLVSGGIGAIWWHFLGKW